MGEKVKQYGTKVKDFFGKLSKKIKVLLLVVLVVAALAIAVLAIVRVSRPYAVVFSNLNSTDMSNILTYMDSTGIKDYKVKNGDTILVRENQVSAVQAKVLQQGYPSSGFNIYDTYSNMVDLLSSDADRVQARLYQLQDSMSAIFRNFDNVKDAAVTISPGENNTYILSTDDKVEASAFVYVEMQAGKELTKQQAQMMMSAMAHAVSGLVIDNVMVTDGKGTDFTGSSSDTLNEATTASELKLRLERQVNSLLKGQVLAAVQSFFGLDNISVGVNCVVDVSRSWVEDLKYGQPEWASQGVNGLTGSKGIINSFIYDMTNVKYDTTTVGGVPGTTSNSDLFDENDYITNPGADITGDKDFHNYGEMIFDNDKTITQQEIPAGRVLDVSVSLAINGSKFTISEEQHKQLVEMVATAAGIDKEVMESKITVMAYPFFIPTADPTPVPGTEPSGGIMIFNLPLKWIIIAGAALLFLLILLIIILVAVHKKKKKKKAAEEALAQKQEQDALAQQALLAALAAGNGEPTQGADIMDIHTEEGMELRKDVRKFVEENPEIAAQMVKSWLKGGDEQHG